MFNFNPFCTFPDMARTGIYYEKKWLWADNSVNIQDRFGSLSFPSLLSIYKPSFISISFVLSTIWPGQGTDGQTDKEAFHSGEHKNVTYEFIERGNILF